MYFCPNKDNAVFIYKTNKSGIKFLNKTQDSINEEIIVSE